MIRRLEEKGVTCQEKLTRSDTGVKLAKKRLVFSAKFKDTTLPTPSPCPSPQHISASTRARGCVAAWLLAGATPAPSMRPRPRIRTHTHTHTHTVGPVRKDWTKRKWKGELQAVGDMKDFTFYPRKLKGKFRRLRARRTYTSTRELKREHTHAR